MCGLCNEASMAGQGIVLTERPAHRLCGRYWEGSYGEAARGAIHSVIRDVQAFAAQREGGWRSPIVGLSWNDRPDGFRYFVGIALDERGSPPRGFSSLALPEMTLASSWHGAGDGDVVAHYVRMIDWVKAENLVWDKRHVHHREEYPHDVDLTHPPALRLLIPASPPPDRQR
jgi:predicted transcriptional regulator YdeE